MSLLTLYRNNDNSIFWPSMSLSDDGTFVTDAEVVATLKDADGVPVPGAANIVLTYIAGSNGDYVGHVGPDVGLTVGAPYTLVYVASSGLNDARITAQVQVLERDT